MGARGGQARSRERRAHRVSFDAAQERTFEARPSKKELEKSRGSCPPQAMRLIISQRAAGEEIFHQCTPMQRDVDDFFMAL